MQNINRFNQILGGILAVQLILTIVVFWSTSATAQSASGPLVAEFEVTNVTEVVIDDGTDRLVLAKTESEEWVLPEADDFPANGTELLPLLENIQAIQNNRRVTTTEASHRRLQVAEDDFNRLIEYTLSDGTTQRLYIGSSAGAGATHVRADGENEVYLTGEINPFEANPRATSWVDTLYFTVPQSLTQKITIENRDGVIEVERVDEETWTLADLADEETFTDAAATTLLNQVTNIRLNSPLGTALQPQYGLDVPTVTVTIEADEVYTLEFGAYEDEDGFYALKASNSPYYVTVAQFTGDNLANKVRSDFVEEAAPVEDEAAAEE